jgi:hypothetical protein
MDDNVISGSCLCGSVRFAIRAPFTGFRYCHCSRCRKASGSAHAANLFVPRTQFEWFCGECGCRVPHEIRTRDDVLVPAGLLDADPQLRPQNSIFWASKAPWYLEPHQMQLFSEYPH